MMMFMYGRFIIYESLGPKQTLRFVRMIFKHMFAFKFLKKWLNSSDSLISILCDSEDFVFLLLTFL